MPRNKKMRGTGQSLVPAPIQQPATSLLAGQQRSMVPSSDFSEPSFHELLRIVLSDPKLGWEQKRKLLDEVRKAGPVDRWTFRYAIWILGTIVMVTIIAIAVLAPGGAEKIPQGLIAIGSTAVGGLAGLLSPGRERDNKS